MWTHKDKKPFACTECSYTCIKKSQINDHMMTHTGEKPFICSVCDYFFTQKSDLKSHYCNKIQNL